MDSTVYPIDCKNAAPSLVLHFRQIKEMMNDNRSITFEISINHVEDINKEDLTVQDNLSTKFLQACYEGDVKKLNQLLHTKEPINFNAKVKNGRTGFMIACNQGSLQIVKKLVRISVDQSIYLDTTDDFGMTAFMIAVNENQFDIVKYLLESPKVQIDFNKKGLQDETPFMNACYYGHKEIVELFLNSQTEIDFDARDLYGDTALTHARENGHEDIVELLEPHVCEVPQRKKAKFSKWT